MQSMHHGDESLVAGPSYFVDLPNGNRIRAFGLRDAQRVAARSGGRVATERAQDETQLRLRDRVFARPRILR